jgi:hypothetical protein
MENIEKIFGKWEWSNKQNANMVAIPINNKQNANMVAIPIKKPQEKKPDGYKSSQSSSLKFL